MKKVVLFLLLPCLVVLFLIFAIAMSTKKEEKTSYSSSCTLTSEYKEKYDTKENDRILEDIKKFMYNDNYADVVFSISIAKEIEWRDVAIIINSFDEFMQKNDLKENGLAILQAYATGYGADYLFFLENEDVSVKINQEYEKKMGITDSKAGYYLSVMSVVYNNCSINLDGMPLDKPFNISGWFPTYSKDGTGGEHFGIDFSVPVGSSLYAVENAEVVLSSQQCDDNGNLGNTCGGFGISGGGNYVILKVIDGDNYYMVSYSHMSKVYVNKGEMLTKGQQVGVSGNSGNSSGPHMHFEVHKNVNEFQLGNSKGVINPCDFIAGLCE